ncbi:hypothetical protein SGLAM104S_07777 [Streptomyces glaucescens]
MTIRVRRGTTSVSGARGTGRGGRSGGVITGQPEPRPPEPLFAAPFAVPGVPVVRCAAEAGTAVAGPADGVPAGEPAAGSVPEPPRAVAAVPAATAALRAERRAPRSRSAASSPRLPPGVPGASGCAGSGTTLVASAGPSGSAGFRSGALITALSIARAPASSSRWAGSLVSRP